MRKKKHPLSGAIYEDLGEGRVRVDKGGKVGIFRADGRWLDGELTYADPHLILWVGGKDLPRPAGRRGQPLPEPIHD